MPSRKEIFQALWCILEVKHLVDNRMYILFLEEAEHLLEPFRRPIEQPFECDVASQCQKI